MENYRWKVDEEITWTDTFILNDPLVILATWLMGSSRDGRYRCLMSALDNIIVRIQEDEKNPAKKTEKKSES